MTGDALFQTGHEPLSPGWKSRECVCVLSSTQPPTSTTLPLPRFGKYITKLGCKGQNVYLTIFWPTLWRVSNHICGDKPGSLRQNMILVFFVPTPNQHSIVTTENWKLKLYKFIQNPWFAYTYGANIYSGSWIKKTELQLNYNSLEMYLLSHFRATGIRL